MNRLSSRASSRLRQPSLRRNVCQLSDTALSLDFSHRLFTPEHYEAGYNYPLVIWLHSHASSEYELDCVMPHLSMRNYVALAIRGTQLSTVGERRYEWGGSETAYGVAEEWVLQAIDGVSATISIDRDKVFLAGHGAGGTLAQWIGLRYSQRVAGVVSIHGGFPRRRRALVDWKRGRSQPVLMMYGDHSNLCDADEVCRTLRLAHAAGLRYRFAQFAAGDEFDTAMAETANRFLMGLVTGECRSRSESSVVEESISNQYDDF